MKARYYLCILATFMAMGLAFSEDDSDTAKTWTIGPEKVPCTGVAPQMCMQVKDSESQNYTLFSGTIEGFCYEPGFEYVIKVLGTPTAGQPADAIPLQWTLLEIISKTGNKTASELEGGLWSLDSYLNREGRTVCAILEPRPRESRPIVIFKDGRVNGKACMDGYFSRYKVDGNNLTIFPNIQTTLMPCPDEDMMAQMYNYLDNLLRAASFNVSGNLLRIRDVNGTTIITFSVLQPPDLTGRTWQMTLYSNSRRHALVSPLAGTQVTAVFKDDGSLAGSAGCNSYTTSYEINGSSIKIAPAGTTKMLCSEPEGIMEQETLYLEALQSAASYEIQVSDLVLFDVNGTRAVIFREAGGI